jgi:hypothetical protein
MFINPSKTVMAPDGQAKPVGPKILDPSRRIGEKPLLPPSKQTPPVAVAKGSTGNGDKVEETRKPEIRDVGKAERIKEKKRKRQLAASDSSETGSSKSTPKLPDKPPKKKPALSVDGEGQGGGSASITSPAVPPRPKPQTQIPKMPVRAPSPPPPPPVKRAPAAGEGLFIKKAKVRV